MYGIFLKFGDRYQILGTKEGEELWFGSLDETIEFIREFNIPIRSQSVIRHVIGKFEVSVIGAEEINQLLAA